jgi:hypothetical protein
VDRRALWNHLRCVTGVSDVFLSVIQSMYDDDAYILQDGGKVTGRVSEFVTSNDKPRIVAYRYIIEASIDVSYRHTKAVA